MSCESLDVKKMAGGLIAKVNDVIADLEGVRVYAECASQHYLEQAKRAGNEDLYNLARRFDGIRHDVERAKNKMEYHLKVYQDILEVNNE